MSSRPISERTLVFLLAAVQFVNILDFMMVMPLGPDFASALGIPTSRLGVVGGIYTAAAAVAGLVGALFLDRFDRRSALGVSMLGLCLATAAGGFADSYPALLAARFAAGAFGGPASASALAILADAIPAERRGKAMGAVMGSFSAASVLGVPAGLELARLGGWRLPFFAVATLGLLLTAGVWLAMPRQVRHLSAGPGGSGRAVPGRPLSEFVRDPMVRLAWLASFVAFGSIFAIIPNLATFLQFNLAFPREHLGTLYLVGGLVSFVAMRVGGRMVDRRGPLPPVWMGTLLLMALIAGTLMPAHSPLPVPAFFVLFMLASSLRIVGLQTLISKIPPATERARFMSAQSSVQHLSTAAGAMVSSLLLVERPDRSLGRMPLVAGLTVMMTFLVPFVLAAILRRQPAMATGPVSAGTALS